MGNDFQKVLGQKLKKVRESLNITLKDASDRMGFADYQILSNIEKGDRHVKAYELAKLSKIYHKDLSYFLGEEKHVEPVVMWREKLNIPTVKEKENEFIQYCNNYHILEKKSDFTLPEVLKVSDIVPEKFSYPQVESLAFEYWKDLQLGSRPACSLKKILEDNLGIKILFLDLGEFGSGASTKGPFGSAILLNKNNTPWRSNYDLAHEFFHIITWDKFSVEDIHLASGKKSEPEKLADYFASCLLLPSESLFVEFNRRLKDDTISFLDCVDLAREFSVSTEALLYRLINLKRLNPKDVKKILEEGEIKLLDKQRRSEDQRELPYLSERYIYLAFKCYQKKLISKGKLAEYLSLERGDVSRFLEKYGYSDKGDYNLELSTT